MQRRHHFILLPLLAIAGCAPMGPTYSRPTVVTPEAHRNAQVSQEQARAAADLAWFELFKEPELTALVRDAIDHNLDLMSAFARIETFRGRAALVGADKKPFVGGSFNTEATSTGTKFDNTYSAGLVFNWEIDFFGRLRRAAEAAQYDLLSSEDGSRAVMASVTTSVAQLYVTARSLDERRAIILRTIQAHTDALDLVRRQAAGGVASGTEVQQALNQLATTRATLPRVERQIVQVENGLSVLLGRAPNAIPRAAPGTLPAVPDIPVGLPSELLERRPDIRASEARLRAATARVGVALASRAWVPRIGLTSSFGRAGTSLDDFFTGGSKAETLFSIGPFLQIPMYDGGAGKARVRISNALAEEAALEFRSTILVSLREVADALVAIQKIREEITENNVRVTASREYLRLTDARYRGGVSSYLEVLDAQRELFNAEIDLSDSRRAQLTSTIDLYLALGGGWSDEELKKLAERPMTATR